MKKLLEIALGIVTSIGGFLEAGSILTAVQAGSEFKFQLGWAILFGTLALIILVEMSGRLSAVSGRTVMDAFRERLGIRLFLIPFVISTLVALFVLASEIAGVSVALSMASGLSISWWALPVTLTVWLLLWRGTFGLVEKGVAILGLVTIAFVMAAFKLHPAWADVGAGLLPTPPHEQPARYGLLAVSILGASISPYLYIFYSSGAIEDKWDTSYLGMNRVVATLGMAFGGILSLAVLVVAAMVFGTKGVTITHFEQLQDMLTPALGGWGRPLFLIALAISCFGAASEIALSIAYSFAQGMGWNWSENAAPARNARFSMVYTGALLLAAFPALLAVDPLKLTNVSMVISAASLPVTIFPLLIIMNDKTYLKLWTNHWVGNVVLTAIALLSVFLFLSAVPLQMLGG